MNNPLKVSSGIIIKENKYLIQRRFKDKPFAGIWEFPGGKVNQNESLEETLIRELKEEINITPLEMRKSKSYFYTFESGIKIDITFFIIIKFKGIPIPKENQIIEWIDISSQIKEPIFEPDKWVIEYLQNGSEFKKMGGNFV
jgi:8-oxo-dGTP diphosphatase